MSYEVARLYTGMCGSKGIDIYKVIGATYALDIGMCGEMYWFFKGILDDECEPDYTDTLNSIKATRYG